ncbi:4-hydroxybenzoate octaprenyltransferase [Janthinobacterium sp. Marseille]|uniref:4-hydroxybenzoate octaprenyltransferase n=1 Tax=Janthinobacterium sp. (strain Marseille) TaxID=375286 RepID=UBIA_JANMA|nr:4-hydroxybenzoate octaprenyltransferase [Janthinobacterium sp. Marseille]A6SUU0.1 RecName: Full=4-hydroxybenzoate octaprenyltransferase; AltName: Full=4-HB polyprenyltransferase [Janthinobacterium sp. Marseille]ABR88736.1 4-hydroxybenzoate octaprenyltransferase [Janthinobacterium sp. Marseille]
MNRLQLYFRLIRLHKPIGILLLLWPTLWALWMASDGKPDWTLVAIFTLGTVLMRSAGCAVNDYADRDFDKHVQRTVDRPITSGKIKPYEALLVALVLTLLAFALIWPLNTLTKQLSIAAVIIAATYPYFKRFFAIPQAYLGIAFGFGIPMGFAAVQNTVPAAAWWLLVANVFWSVAYDTEYAMVDREDDLKLGMKTSAITFGRYDVAIIMFCYAMTLGIIGIVGWQFGLRIWFVAGLLLAAVCAAYHYTLIRSRERAGCFAAFNHNNWLGGAIFGGVALDYLLR